MISKIAMPSSAYQSGSTFFSGFGPIFIEINKEALDQKNNLLTALNNNSLGFKFRTISMYGPYMLISDNIDKFRQIVDFLFASQLINSNDRANIETEIRLIEKNFSLQAKVTPQITSAQLDIIKSMCEEHIDCLLDVLSAEEIPDCIGLLDNYPGAYKGYYNFKHWLSKNGVHVSEPTQQELIESFEYLGKVYHGIGNLEETYIKTGVGIPQLEQQQQSIKDLIHLKISERTTLKNT